MFLPETLKPSKVLFFSLFILFLAGCFSASEHPFSPGLPQEESLSLNYLAQPPGSGLESGTKCKSEVVAPDRVTRVGVKFVELNFPAGCVPVSTQIEVCTDGTVYAVDLTPHGTTFLLPVEVEFSLPILLFDTVDLAALTVMYISPEGMTEEIPFALQTKKDEITIIFSIDHFSRYALVID
jgi:hypothetical protein